MGCFKRAVKVGTSRVGDTGFYFYPLCSPRFDKARLTQTTSVKEEGGEWRCEEGGVGSGTRNVPWLCAAAGISFF